MPAGIYKISVDQGSTLRFKYTYRNPPTTPGVKGDPIDISGYAARGQVRAKATDTTALMDLDFLIPDPTNGQIFMTVKPSKTSLIPVRGKNYTEKTTLYYDIELYNTTDPEDVIRLLNGEFVLSPEQTKSST